VTELRFNGKTPRGCALAYRGLEESGESMISGSGSLFGNGLGRFSDTGCTLDQRFLARLDDAAALDS
jgi:hypothetical protein